MASNFSDIVQALGAGLLLAVAVAAIAPIAYGILARNIGAILTSIALIFGAAGLLVTGKTVVHEVLAAVLYLAALLSAATLYGAARVQEAIKEEGKATRAQIRESFQALAQARTTTAPSPASPLAVDTAGEGSKAGPLRGR